MRPKVAMRAALDAPALLGGALGGESRATWRVLLMAAMGEPLTAEELVIFSRITGGRSLPPTAMVEELLGIVGRRGGKTSAMAALLIYLGELCDHRDRLVRGERGVVLLIAPDQRQARVRAGVRRGRPGSVAGAASDGDEQDSGHD